MTERAYPAVDVLVIAKAPMAGRSKTRLSPPCSPEQAAVLAEAALVDTLEVVLATPGIGRRVLVLDGEAGAWLPPGVDVLRQRGDGLDERLSAAFADVGGPALLLGMDTPQVTPALLAGAVRELGRPGVDAVLGRADDGGYWAIGLREPDPEVFLGVPMSAATTAECQRRRLDRLGRRVAELPRLRDVDRIDDAWAVAAAAPGSRFSRALRRITAPVGAAS